MSLASRKAAFIQANGNPITIIRSSGNISTTARIMPIKREKGAWFQASNNLREGLFIADSGLQRGDLIEDQTTGEQYYVVGFQTRTVEAVITSIRADLFMVNYTNNVSVTVTRIVQDPNPTYDAYGRPTNSTTSTFTVNVFVQGRTIELDPELSGGKRKETLKMIAGTGTFLLGDEVSYLGHTFKVELFESDNMSNAVDFVHAIREVD